MKSERLISVQRDEQNMQIVFFVDDFSLAGKSGYRELRLTSDYSDVNGNGLRARVVDSGTRAVVVNYFRGEVVWELDVRTDEEVRRLPSTLCEMHRLFARKLSRRGTLWL